MSFETTNFLTWLGETESSAGAFMCGADTFWENCHFSIKSSTGPDAWGKSPLLQSFDAQAKGPVNTVLHKCELGTSVKLPLFKCSERGTTAAGALTEYRRMGNIHKSCNFFFMRGRGQREKDKVKWAKQEQAKVWRQTVSVLGGGCTRIHGHKDPSLFLSTSPISKQWMGIIALCCSLWVLLLLSALRCPNRSKGSRQDLGVLP